MTSNLLLLLISLQCFGVALVAYKRLSINGPSLFAESIVQSGMLAAILSMIFAVHGLILG